MLIETITSLILNGNTEQARKEIEANKEFSKITGKARELNDLQERDLNQAIVEAEIGAYIMTRDQHAKIETNMKRQITRLNNKSKGSAFNLEEKLTMKHKVKKMREQLRQHVLNVHELTA